jgi:hypothetical protein
MLLLLLLLLFSGSPTGALQNFGGAVCAITHNAAFAEALQPTHVLRVAGGAAVLQEHSGRLSEKDFDHSPPSKAAAGGSGGKKGKKGKGAPAPAAAAAAAAAAATNGKAASKKSSSNGSSSSKPTRKRTTLSFYEQQQYEVCVCVCLFGRRWHNVQSLLFSASTHSHAVALCWCHQHHRSCARSWSASTRSEPSSSSRWRTSAGQLELGRASQTCRPRA